MELTKVHPFERAGLGIAPFKFVGLEHRTFQATPVAWTEEATRLAVEREAKKAARAAKEAVSNAS